MNGISIDNLDLKNRKGKKKKMSIVDFVGSKVESEEKEIVKMEKRIKKEKVNVDIVRFGEEV
jgi:26S proteasome regulatory subunit N10